MAREKQPGQGVSEREVIRRIRARFPEAGPGVAVGIGDDAAVLSPTTAGQGLRLDLPNQIVTTDILIEGCHFDLRYMTLADVGYKALAVNLSDVAAMGAAPQYAFGTLGLPPGATAGEVEELLSGVAQAAEEGGVALAGGDTVAAPQWVAGFTVLGAVAGPPLLRRGAQPGDVVWHSGQLGLSQVGLHLLTGGGVEALDPAYASAVQAHRRPQPRLKLGRYLQLHGLATACLDLSDSLSQCLLLLAEASGVGLHLDLSAYPYPPAVARFIQARRQRPRLGAQGFAAPGRLDPRGQSAEYATWAAFLLSCAEDYELLFTAPAAVSLKLVRESPVLLTRLGVVGEAAEGCFYRAGDGRTHPLVSTGFEHR